MGTSWEEEAAEGLNLFLFLEEETMEEGVAGRELGWARS